MIKVTTPTLRDQSGRVYRMPPTQPPNAYTNDLGGNGGQPFDDYNALGQNVPYIKAVQVNAGDTLDHLMVLYLGRNDPIQHGTSNGGSNVYPWFVLNEGADETIIKVEVWVDLFNGTFQVTGLRFTTAYIDFSTGHLAYRTSDLFGQAPGGSGGYFEVPPLFKGGICCFWGRQGYFLDSLGVYLWDNSGPSPRSKAYRDQ